ncbi:DJ-1/PfpI family protein [Piscinibacter sp. XHJ-5]|uniref:DJ-1/PfpI family protein n=1 Tax=Piscinibacter sp. XHJ-5 TaxID=3037797 RepID=UPI002452F21F|nr:DJ-1/PfpI family protein [Piscinibacter sp. XHJ-5]
MNVGIVIFDDVELLDMAGPYEVFTTAARVHARGQPTQAPPLFTVGTIARNRAGVQARAGLHLQPEHTLHDHPPLDCAIVPGGVVDAELHRVELLAWIASQAQQARILASVCTGALLLAQAGVLDDLEATTHWEDVAALRALRPGLRVREGVRWVDAGAVVTSAGISAGIDMSLHLVQRLHSRDLALRTARQMEFDWSPAQGKAGQ